MKKAIVIVTLLMLVVLITSCKRSDTSIKAIPNFRIGIGGIEIKFLENSPPKELYYTEKAQVPIGIEIRNNGAEKAFGVIAFNLDGYKRLVLENIDSNIYDSSSNLVMISNNDGSDLKGKRVENPNGDLRVFTVMAEPAPLNPQTEQFKSTIIATACYDYSTEFTPEVCIDTDIYNTKPIAKACKVQDIIGSKGQGAPVSVDKVEVQMLPSGKGISPQLTITLKNSGKGEVIRYGNYKEVCSQKTMVSSSTSSTQTNFNIVRVGAYIAGSGIELDCLPKKEDVVKEISSQDEELFGYARFSDKTATIVCRYIGVIPESAGNYVSKLRIVANYGYTESISKEVLIKVPLPKR